MNNITCGQCVCPAPIPTPDPFSTDLCQAINSTHSICHMNGGLPSWSGAFLSGVVVAIVVMIFLYILYNLFGRGYSEVKK